MLTNKPRFEIRTRPIIKNEQVYGILYYIFDNLTGERASGWMRYERDARTILRWWEDRRCRDGKEQKSYDHRRN